VIEVTTFRLAAGVDEATFREADSRYQTEFAYGQPGLLRRTVARGQDGEWLVVTLWRSADDADAAGRKAAADPGARAYDGLLDLRSVRAARYLELDA